MLIQNVFFCKYGKHFVFGEFSQTEEVPICSECLEKMQYKGKLSKTNDDDDKTPENVEDFPEETERD